MKTKFKVGDHVSWNPIAIGSESGHISYIIIKVHKSSFNYKRYRHRATQDGPQFEMKSD